MNDNTLISLYREYCEEEWAAGWIMYIETDPQVAAAFTEWLKEKESLRSSLLPYEEDALPILRQCWHNALLAQGKEAN